MALLTFRDDGRASFYCPGCNRPHVVGVTADVTPRWDWNGDTEAPTITPLIANRLSSFNGAAISCACYILAGVIHYDTELTNHAFAGLAIDMVDMP